MNNGKIGNNGSNGNGDKLSRLLERQKELDAQLATEKIRLLKRKQKDDKKLFAWVGRTICEAAEKSPEFRLMIAQTLGGAIADPAARRFLEGRGYIA
jgi:hypothetical protein